LPPYDSDWWVPIAATLKKQLHPRLLKAAAQVSGEFDHHLKFARQFGRHRRAGEREFGLQQEPGDGRLQVVFKAGGGGAHGERLLLLATSEGGLDLASKPRTAEQSEVDLQWDGEAGVFP
jgi:hypothetical protein